MGRNEKVTVFQAHKGGLSKLNMDIVTMNEAVYQIPDGVYTAFPIY